MFERIRNFMHREPKLPLVDLSTLRGYNIAAAIRGPDCRDDRGVLKRAFTARLRYLAGLRDWGSTRGDGSPITPFQVSQLVERASERNVRHYLIHALDGAHALGADGLKTAAGILLASVKDPEETIDESELLALLNKD